ncbi:Peptidase family M23 [Parelusimicrobium proximum]|uniref:M23 family metallopeptidase n=1 Tax=Parelusimicrobium proximum TaxID=3228953 RepID=UPI003D182AC3
MKKFFSQIYNLYCRNSHIIFYILIVCVIAAGAFLVYSHSKKREALLQLQEAAANEPKFVTQGDVMAKTPLYTKLEQTGLDRREIYNITSKLDAIMYTRKLNPRDKFLISLTEDGKFSLLVVNKDLTNYYVANVGGELIAGIIDKEVRTTEKSASGKINSSLFVSMQSKGLNVPLIVDFTDVFSWNIDFNSETRNGDEYAVVYEEDATTDGMIVAQAVIAAKYKGSAAGTNYAYYFDGDFYDETGKMSKRMFLKSPISFRNVRITSRFSAARKHPILRIVRPHYGIDYAAPSGTPVETIGDGRVIFAGWKGGFGNYVEVSHANGFVSCYGHLKSYNVKTGDKVKQGSVIGRVGSTGLSTGPHLDFRIREHGKYLDFLKMRNRNSSVKEIEKPKLAEFKKVVEKYKPFLDSDIKETSAEEEENKLIESTDPHDTL